MKLSLARRDLHPAIAAVTRVVERRNTLPILSNLVLETDGGEIIGRDPKLIPLSAFDSAGVEILRPFKAIRARCVDCCGGSQAEVRKCVSIKCPLWPMRMGKLPAHLRVKSSEDEEA